MELMYIKIKANPSMIMYSLELTI